MNLEGRPYPDIGAGPVAGHEPSPGIVYLLGQDPGLITIRGMEILRASDVVVYDRLVHPALLLEAPVVAERLFAGKDPHGYSIFQDAINAVLIDRARAGLRVVRLKGGDPFVFGRGAEECEALRDAGIRFEIVPGVSSAVAVPAYAGVPVTHPRYASAFAVVTGQECGSAPGLDWDVLARFPVLVILMGLRTLPEIARRLVAHGASPSISAAVVNNGTMPRQ